MKNIIKLGMAALIAAFLYGCTTANAADVIAPADIATVSVLTSITTTTTTTNLMTETTTINTTTIATSSITSQLTSKNNTVLTSCAAVAKNDDSQEMENFETTAQEKILEKEASEENEEVKEFIVFKPSTHYLHMNTCHWVNDECYEIEDTNGIECRKCSECNPEIEIINEYIEPTPVVAATAGIDDYSRTLLAEIVWHEAGSSWIDTYDKAQVAAGVMNRVNDSRFPDTVYAVLTQQGQFTGYWPGCCTPTQDCYDAVDYYFNNSSSFGNINSWSGDGTSNHFYYQ